MDMHTKWGIEKTKRKTWSVSEELVLGQAEKMVGAMSEGGSPVFFGLNGCIAPTSFLFFFFGHAMPGHAVPFIINVVVSLVVQLNRRVGRRRKKGSN